jgi:hypothetical protein
MFYDINYTTVRAGCFLVKIYKSKTKIGLAVHLIFNITQHTRDEQLMRRGLVQYLGAPRWFCW